MGPRIHAGLHSGRRWRFPLAPERRRETNVVPAPAVLMAEQFRDKEFGFTGGQMLPSPPIQPAPQPVPASTIPPADWEQELEHAAPFTPPANDGISALDRMRIDGDDVPEPPDWGPPMVVKPMPRIEFEPPDWRAEEQERRQEGKP